MPGTLSVDINHWLTEDGDIPDDNPRIRKNALRIARVIEYGGPLEPLHGRETLMECRCRPKGKACPGLIWVSKRVDNRLEAFCLVCRHVEALVSSWETTDWAEGPMEAVPMTDG